MSNNLVWTKLSNVWWVGEKLDEPPEDAIPNSKKEVQVVRFFDETLHTVSNPKFIVEYESSKEELIRSGLRLLKKKETTLKEFIRDITEAEKRSGGDENIIEKYREPADATPRKSVVSEIFKTEVVEKKPTPPTTPITPGIGSKAGAKKNQSPRKPRGPTPQIAHEAMKYVCPKCNYSTNRVNVLTLHMKSHTAESTVSTPVQKTVHKVDVPTPEKSTSRSARQPAKTSPKVATPKRIVTPKKAPARKSVKRKAAGTPQKEIAVEDILADWSDAEDESHQKEKKKPKTSQEIFDSLLQATHSPSSETGEDKTNEVKVEVQDVNECTVIKDELDEDQMDVDEMGALSNNSTPVSELETASTKEKTPKELEQKDDDLGAKIDELLEETKVTLPSFGSPKKSTAVVEALASEQGETEQPAASEVNMSIEKVADTAAFALVEKEEAGSGNDDLSEEKPTAAESEIKMDNRLSDVASGASTSVTETNGEDITEELGMESKESVPVAAPVAPVVLDSSPVPTKAPSPVQVEESKPDMQQPLPTPEKVVPPSAISKPKLEALTPLSSASTPTPPPPVYAKKSLPQLIDDKPIKPKRTYASRRRPSAATLRISEMDTPLETDVATGPKIPANDATPVKVPIIDKSQLPIEVKNVNSSLSVAFPRKKEAAVVTTLVAPVPTAVQSIKSVGSPNTSIKSSSPIKSVVVDRAAGKASTASAKPKALTVEPSKPTTPTKTIPTNQRSSPTKSSRKLLAEVTKPILALQADLEGTKGISKPVIQQQYLITSATGAVIAPEPVAALPVPAAVEGIKKPTSVASSSPTASSLALAQRKKDSSATTPKSRGRATPGRKSQPGSSEVTTGKPTATVKPTVNVEEDSIIRQALQVQKGTIKSSPPAEQKRETPVEQVVHVVPVQNPDGSVSYMFLSLNDSDELKLDQLEGPTPTNNLEAVYIDKTVDCETLMTTLNPPQSQQIQLQLPQTFSSQAPSRQGSVSQQVKQIAATSAIASSSSSQPQFISETVVAPQQFVFQQDGQEILNLGANTIVQNEDGSFMDFSQLSSGDNNIYFMTEDGSIIDPAQCGMSGADIQQFLGTQ